MNSQIIKSPNQLKAWLRSCRPVIALDTETTSLNYLDLEIVGVSLCDGKQACYIPVNKCWDKMWALLSFWLEEFADLVICHNSPFDMKVLYKYGVTLNKVACTQTAAFLLDENRLSYKLKDLAHTILKVPKEKIKKYDEVDQSNPLEFATYAINDAVWTFQIFEKFYSDIQKQGLDNLFWNIEMPFQRCLMDLAINGALVDLKAAEDMRYKIQHLHCQLEDELFRYIYEELWDRNKEEYWGNWYFNITPRSRKVTMERHVNFNSPDQLIPVIEALGINITEKTKKGKKSIGKAFKKRVAGTHPLIDKWIKYTKVDKLLHGFLEPFQSHVQADGRIRPSFHNTVAVTGRLTCSNPNLEQLPKNNDIANIRDLFIAPVRKVLIVADYSGQELRLLAEVTGDATMKGEFIRGEDLHQNTADAFKVTRDEAKTVGFGIAYGKTAFGFAKDFRCSMPEAEEVLNKYFSKYTAIPARMERNRGQISRFGWCKNMSGRRRRFPTFAKEGPWGKKRMFRQAFNFLIQSAAADMLKIAAGRAVLNPKLLLVNLIHDELVFECDEDYAEEGVKWVRDVMINAVKMSIPLEVDIKVGNCYGNCKG